VAEKGFVEVLRYHDEAEESPADWMPWTTSRPSCGLRGKGSARSLTVAGSQPHLRRRRRADDLGTHCFHAADVFRAASVWTRTGTDARNGRRVRAMPSHL
jgi:hypothetical protein